MAEAMQLLRQSARGGAVATLLGLSACVPAPQSFRTEPMPAVRRVAVLPLANFTPSREAPERVAPMLAAAVGARPGVQIVDPGAVEAALGREPWLLLDRIPPDLVERFGSELSADALLVGALLAYGYRDTGGERVPQISLSLRLVATPGGQVLWSSVHSRDGQDGEWLFGFGRVHALEQLASRTVAEALATFPDSGGGVSRPDLARKGK